MENQIAIYAEYMAFMHLNDKTRVVAYYKFSSVPQNWGRCVKNYNKENCLHKAFYKANYGVVIEAAFKGPDNWWQVFEKVNPPSGAYIIDASKAELRF